MAGRRDGGGVCCFLHPHGACDVRFHPQELRSPGKITGLGGIFVSAMQELLGPFPTLVSRCCFDAVIPTPPPFSLYGKFI